MTRAEYEADICKRLPTAKAVEFRDVGITERCCHTNVDRWVNEHLEEKLKPVRGWIVYEPQAWTGDGLAVKLTAHSVVSDEQGNLFDITPTDERMRRSLQFVEHIGDPETFCEFKESDRFIFCPNCA